MGALRGLAWTGAFVVLFVLFSVATFPEDSAREYVETRGGDALGGALTVGGLDVKGLYGGVELTEVALRLPEVRAEAGPGVPMPSPDAPPPKPRILTADRIDVDWGLLGLLAGEIEADFEADVMGGTIRGGKTTLRDEGASELSIEAIEGVRLGAEGLFKGLVGYDLRGVLAGTVALSWNAAVGTVEGSIDIALSGAKVVAPTIPTRQLGPIVLSDLDLGELQLKLAAGREGDVAPKKGRGRRETEDTTAIVFEDVGASGADVEVQFDDASVIRMMPGTPFDRATMDVHLAVHFTDAFFDRSVTAEDGTTSQPNKILRMALQQDAKLRSATRDGVLGIACRGLVSKPDCRPEPPRVRGFKSRKPRFTGSEEEPPAEGAEPTTPAPGTEGRPGERDQEVRGRAPGRPSPMAGRGARPGGPTTLPEGTVEEEEGDEDDGGLGGMARDRRSRLGDLPGRVSPMNGRYVPGRSMVEPVAPIRATPLGGRPVDVPPPTIVPSPAPAEDEASEAIEEAAEEESQEVPAEEGGEAEGGEVPAEGGEVPAEAEGVPGEGGEGEEGGGE